MINMTNNDEEMAIQQDPVDLYTRNCDFEDDSDYDEDFMDALMSLDEPMADFSNSDSVPGIPMKQNHKELLKGRYFVLNPGDIVCGRMHGMNHHPGNVLFELIVSEFVLQYGLATSESKRQSLLAEVHAQIEMASCSAGRRPPRYVFPAITSDGLPYYQAARQEAITEETKYSMKSHFNVIPKPSDVLFGRGQPCRDFPGNVRLRTFIDNQRPQYASARPADRRRLIQVTRESVTSVGGRFLLPFDKARPMDGCVEASDEAIKKKIAHLYRGSPTLRQEGVEIVQAHLVDELLTVPLLLHIRPEVAPVSSNTKDAETAMSEDSLDGASITSSSDQSTDTADSSNASSARFTMTLKTCLFKWRTVLLCLTIVNLAIDVGIIIVAFTPRNEGESALENIQSRGKLRCGITNQIGYSSKNNSTGLWDGFEVDICRAQAAAIFGKNRFYQLSSRGSEPVEYVEVMPSERFHALKNNKVDILFAVTS